MDEFEGTLTIVLAIVIVVIVVITLIINICVICRNGCWICKKTPNFDLVLPLTTFQTDVPELPVDGSQPPILHDVGSAQYAAVLPRSQRSNALTAPAVGTVPNCDLVGMTVIDDSEHFDDVNNVNGQTADDTGQQQVVTAEVLKNALYASVLPRSQRLALTKTTCKEPLNEEADETDSPKTVHLGDSTDVSVNATEKVLDVGQVHTVPRFHCRPKATSTFYVDTDVMSSKEVTNSNAHSQSQCYYMNTTETRMAAKSSSNPHQRLQSNTFPMLGSSQVDAVEPLYAEAREVDTRLMISTSSLRPPEQRCPVAAGPATATVDDGADEGHYYANYSREKGFATIV